MKRNPFNENTIMSRVYDSILEKTEPIDPKDPTKKGFIKNGVDAVKHPKYQKLMITNGLASAGGAVGGSLLLDKVVHPLTETIGEDLKSKAQQDLNFVKGIGNGVYKIGKSVIKVPYKAGIYIANKTPAPVGSAIRLGTLGYLGYKGIQHLENN